MSGEAKRTRVERALDLPQRVLEGAVRRSPDALIVIRGAFNLARQIARSRAQSVSRSSTSQ